MPLKNVLWEVAVAFGRARLVAPDSQAGVEFTAIGDRVPWAPFHATSDLLSQSLFRPATGKATANARTQTAQDKEPGAKGPSAVAASSARNPAPGEPEGDAARQSSIGLGSSGCCIEISVLCERRHLSNLDIQNVAGLNSATTQELRRFLLSGQFIKTENDTWVATDALDLLWAAVRATDLTGLDTILRRAPSLARFCDILEERGLLTSNDRGEISSRAFPTYQALAEISAVAAPIADEGLYSTPNDPPPAQLAALALTRAFSG